MPYDPAVLDAGGDRASARRTLGLPPDRYIIACFGYVAAYKRMEVVVEAFERIQKDCPEALLLVVGKVQDEYADTFGRLSGEAR